MLAVHETYHETTSQQSQALSRALQLESICLFNTYLAFEHVVLGGVEWLTIPILAACYALWIGIDVREQRGTKKTKPGPGWLTKRLSIGHNGMYADNDQQYIMSDVFHI